MRIMIAALALLAAAPAMAQQPTPTYSINSRADCIANFRIADWNGDGWLTRDEYQGFPNIIPTYLLQRDAIDRQAYLSACGQEIRHQRGN